jgi:hypothetical protein
VRDDFGVLMTVRIGSHGAVVNAGHIVVPKRMLTHLG